jgi:Arc/MetJ family transcription regulator
MPPSYASIDHIMRMDDTRRTSLILDVGLVQEAGRVLGTQGTTRTVERALREVVDRQKRQALAGWDLSDLGLDDLARLRESQPPA